MSIDLFVTHRKGELSATNPKLWKDTKALNGQFYHKAFRLVFH